MTWDMWCGLISSMKDGCLLEQLLCEGKLPLVCERCGHALDSHQFDVKDGVAARTFCNANCCWDKNEYALCPEYVGDYVET